MLSEQAPIVHVCRGFPGPWKTLKCHPNRPRQICPCNPGRYHSSDAERLRVHWWGRRAWPCIRSGRSVCGKLSSIHHRNESWVSCRLHGGQAWWRSSRYVVDPGDLKSRARDINSFWLSCWVHNNPQRVEGSHPSSWQTKLGRRLETWNAEWTPWQDFQ